MTSATEAAPGTRLNLRDRLGPLPELMARLDHASPVPGMSVGVLLDDEVEVFVHGLANAATGAEVHPDTVFQIGSNTKLWTATVVMKLVEEGLVELDTPVTKYVPEFRLSHAEADTVTVRHLLTHSGGFLGDFFGNEQTETIADFVDQLATVVQLHPVGAMWSYCNSGFVLLGRLIEKVTGLDYDKALRAKILDPIGDTHTRVRFEEIIPLRAAVGHAPTAEDGLDVTPYGIMPACAPAGSVPVSSAADVLRFVRLHLDHGRAPDGSQVLDPATVALMQTKQIDVPAAMGRTRGLGLGWMLRTLADGQRVIGHGGATPSGQFSLLEVVPERRLAVVVLTNGPGGPAAAHKVVEHVLAELAGSTLAPDPIEWPDPAPTVDLTKYVGTYAAGSMQFDVSVGTEHEGLLMTATAVGIETPQGAPPSQTAPLVALDRSLFAIPMPGMEQQFEFVGFDDTGRPGYLFVGRIYPRVG